MSKPDAFSAYDPILAQTPSSDPWLHGPGEARRYGPDFDLLGKLLSVPVQSGEVSESGRFAKGIDAWLSHELRRSGFGEDEVWPRATRPRVLPRDLAVLLDKLPNKVADEVRRRLPQLPSVGPADAKVLGRAYYKQVDVCIARWDRGPELLISTKAQLSSFGKNLPNRFEEAYGDAANLRGRYPLAAVGFFFVQRATILESEPDAFERTVDMIRKLRDLEGANGYTATGLALVDWSGSADELPQVNLHSDEIPDDVGPAQFLSAMIHHVTKVTPVVHHVAVRSKMERRGIPVAEQDSADAMAEASGAE
ncbi:hypothetical protein [Paractinoplanes lichenicola]|uniref:Restriction endonuclease n=1 Tax=Paractinoplanes lichenicola TaxID=2802976 RepID=A0ABS1VSQ1_9ACTN|nr:hypothetical protein [Actinoplanes lichenicola]MBL7257236.1 hypothetical protein [Actinoplanes lichenicola]